MTRCLLSTSHSSTLSSATIIQILIHRLGDRWCCAAVCAIFVVFFSVFSMMKLHSDTVFVWWRHFAYWTALVTPWSIWEHILFEDMNINHTRALYNYSHDAATSWATLFFNLLIFQIKWNVLVYDNQLVLLPTVDLEPSNSNAFWLHDLQLFNSTPHDT